MKLRSQLLAASQCSFNAEITADYGEQIYSFGVECSSDSEGNVQFCVSAPETIAGIMGHISHTGGALTFDDAALQFSQLADDQLTPVAAPWLFLKTLRSGYITSACMEDAFLRLTLNDSYEEGALQADIWVDASDRPVRCDFLYEGKRILSLNVTEFQLL